MQRARSITEARLYIDRQPCPGCGHQGFAEPSRIVEHGDDLAVACNGYCPRCGAARAFELVLAEERVPPGTWGGADPSTLIDAGEWMLLAEEHSSGVPASVATLPPDDRRRARADLAVAIAALAEVAKFIPTGAERPPQGAFFTARGKQAYLAEPGRFTRTRLAAVDATWRRLAAELDGQ